MTATDYRNMAALAASAIAGQAAGSALLDKIEAGADIDEMYRQVSALAGDPVALRSLCRVVQKTLERAI